MVTASIKPNAIKRKQRGGQVSPQVPYFKGLTERGTKRKVDFGTDIKLRSGANKMFTIKQMMRLGIASSAKRRPN